MSGLSFVVVRCGGWEFFAGGMGGLGMKVYYKTENGVNYPREQTGL